MIGDFWKKLPVCLSATYFSNTIKAVLLNSNLTNVSAYMWRALCAKINLYRREEEEENKR